LARYLTVIITENGSVAIAAVLFIHEHPSAKPDTIRFSESARSRNKALRRMRMTKPLSIEEIGTRLLPFASIAL
jgi:hypothetical protein